MEKIVFDDLLKPTDILKIARNLYPLERHTTGVLTVEEKIQEEIYHIVSNTYFIPVYGKKLIKPTDIISWENNFPYHFEENETIANYNLPIKEINDLSQIYQNFSEIKNDPIDPNIFYYCKLKSANKKQRKNSLCLLLDCFEKNISFREEFFDDLFLDQKLFLDTDDILICLNEGPFFLKNMNNVPSCIKKKQLSDESKKLVNDEIFNKDKTNDITKSFFKKYIFRQYNDILNFLPILLNKWNDEDNNSNEILSWNKYGFEVLKYLFNIYHKNKETDFDELKEHIKLPTRQNKYWNHAHQIYLTTLILHIHKILHQNGRNLLFAYSRL